MKRSTTMLAGVATVALAAGGMVCSPAMAEPIPAATSYADLLEPVPNAMERLAVADANQPTAHLELAQYGGPNAHHHHHHHHHHHNRRWYRANGYSWSGGQWILRPVAHHHHHHHHHHQNGY